MALTPPDNNEGKNAVDWELVLATNNQIIDRTGMPKNSTVEYKGYYKAEATGIHKFNLNGDANDITGYSWVSSAPANSDHIKGKNRGARLVSNRSFAIQIPDKPRFRDEQILGGSNPGLGYWPKEGYGNSIGFNYIYSGKDTPSTDCSYNQVVHQYLVPGDIRTYGKNEFPKFQGRPAGPGWNAPEDPNFSAPCWPSEYSRPLVNLDNELDNPVDNFAVSTTQGKVSQVTLDNSFIAGGVDNFASFESVAIDGNDEDHIYIWPKQDMKIGANGSGPERIQIKFGVFFFQETQDYTFEWKSRDGLKMWYRLAEPKDNRYFKKFPTTSGNNPCNFTASPSGNSGWLPGGGFDGFTGKLKIKQNTYIILHGSGVGIPEDDTHGFSIVIKNSNGDIVFDSTDLLARGDKIGIDECGYNALLNDESRLPGNRVTEFYKSDGWNGIDNDIFTADSVVGDETERDPSTTRQYLWSNSITRVSRNGEGISGEVFLRQGDYYFIRTIVSSNIENGGFAFVVTTPIGESKSVMFSGNSNPGSDTSVGGSYGGSGITKEKLCDSVLFRNNTAISDNTNFAVVDKLGIVLNLTQLGLSSRDIGREGQDEKITGSTGGGDGSGAIPPPPSTECIESQSQKCEPYDFGPGGNYAGGATYQVEVGPGQVVSMPFTVVPGDWSGKISRYPTSSGNVPDGAYGRFWLSATPGGEPLSIDSSEVGGTEAAWRWHLAGATDPEGFEIPNVAAVYYYNWTRCGPPDSDRTCSDPSTPPATQTHDILFRGTKSQGSGNPPPPSTECISVSEGPMLQECLPYDFGPGGNNATGSTYEVTIEPHTVYSMPFTIVEGSADGAITRAPTSVGLQYSDDCFPRYWISETPGGEPLSDDCSHIYQSEGDLKWHQPGASNTYGCEIPSINAVYYFNMARCGGDTADQNCSDLSNRIEGQQPLATLLAGRVVSREGDSFTSSSDLEANTDVNVVIGDLDFGSGGGDSGVKTHFVWVPNEIIAYPFTVKQGNYHGRVGIYPTSSPYPTDGSGIRLWWSRTPGGEQLPGTDCNPDVGKLSSHNWTQVISERSYGCQIPNEDATLYLNVQACISTYDDLNCTADGAKPGSVVPTYIAGRVFVRDDDTPVTPTTPTTPAASSALTSARDTTKDNGSAILKFKYNTRYENINITLNELVRNGGEDIATDEKKKWIVINEYINQIGQESGQEKTMEYSDFMAAINRQAVMQWGSGGNYQYVYHAVGVIIESICNGTEIIQTDLSGANNSNNSNNRNNSNNNNVGEPTCIDIDVTNISGGAGLITSECLDECKHPKDYPALSTEYQKYKSNYQNSDSSYYDSIVIKKDATLYYKGPDKSALNGDKYSLFQSQIDKNIRFESGTVTSIPFTVPDYYEPDWINQKDAIDYNSFYMDIDVATFIGDVTPGSEPELLVWWSTYAGGPALGESFIIVVAGGTEVVATFSSLLLNKNSDINIVGYLGNKYGSRWINFATVNKDLSEAISVKDLEIGSTAFMNRLSNFGLELNGSNQKNSLTLSMTIPVPDCSKLVTVSSSNITTQPSDTMRSLPNMNPYIGDDWDGSIPSHVEIATNGGYKWGYAPGSQPFPAGFGPGNESPRLTGSLVYYPQPTNGKILSYEWASTNKKIVPSLSLTWVWSPSGGQQVLNSCSPSLTVVRWFSATPGGRPLLNIDGQRRIFDIGDATNDRNFRMQQLYDVNDSYIDYFYTIPVITKKYFLNAACIESSLFATLEAQGRAPTASEVREFNPLACGSDTSYSYVVGGPTGSSYDFDTWLKEKPSKGERFI